LEKLTEILQREGAAAGAGALFRVCCWILLGMSVVTFFLFAADKRRAVRGKWRIRESALLLVSLFGGAAGGLLAMGFFRHKIRKPAFYIGLPLMLTAQIAGLFYLFLK